MARFSYQGRDKNGRKSGKITSNSRREALGKLRESGIRVIEIQEIPENIFTKDIQIGNPVKLQDFVIFIRQFATLLKAGVTVVESVNILSNQTESKPLKRTLLEVEADLREGNPLSTATAKHKRIFSTLFTSMIKAGEAGGNLDETLERLAVHFEKQHRTKQKIVSALAYPITVGIIALVVVAFLLVAVVPTFVDMFADFGAELPVITKFVLNASEFMQKMWWLILLFLIGLFIAFQTLKKQKKNRYYIDYISLKIPVFGTLLQKAALARMTRTLSSLFSSTVPILQALSIVENVVENEVITRVLRQSRESLEKGQSLTAPMKNHWAFPPIITQMIAIGEETGALDEMLGKVADFYEDEVESSTDRLKSLIEPLMIVLLAGVVGTIVAAILIPMFDIFNHIQM
jgi:type IV pilus assembly protein PilC